MKNIEDLFEYANSKKISIKEFIDKSKNLNGLCLINNSKCKIYLNKANSNIEQKCVLAEELGHYEKGITSTLLSKTDNDTLTTRSINEFRAKKWATNLLIPFEDFKRFLTSNYSKFDIANELDVTEDIVDFAYWLYEPYFLERSDSGIN